MEEGIIAFSTNFFLFWFYRVQMWLFGEGKASIRDVLTFQASTKVMAMVYGLAFSALPTAILAHLSGGTREISHRAMPVAALLHLYALWRLP